LTADPDDPADDPDLDPGSQLRLLYPWLADGADLGVGLHLDPATGAPRIIERRFEVGLDHAGWRLDHYLKQMIPRLSRTRLQAIIAHQLRRADGRPVKPSTAVAPGDVLVLRRPARAEPPCPRAISILVDDPSFVVVDKPAGLPVHASAKFYFNTLTAVLRERFGDPAPQICHRLDRETSGALVCARTREAAAVIKGAFASKRVDKTYLAIVHGQPPFPDDADAAPDAVIDVPLALAGAEDATELPGVRMVAARPGRPDALPSITHVRVLGRTDRYALVRCRPVTGRQHQIRAHLACAGHPIVGDKLYAHGDAAFRRFCDEGLTPELAALFVLPRQALHAAEIVFPHPDNLSKVRVISPLAPELRDFLDRS
jgi:23S rRNA pseudouridine1911/1915/1917 synthase